MKDIIIGILIGVILAGIFCAVTSYADSSWIGIDAIYNRVFNSSTNTLTIIGI